tara:strand:+ start:424 stop:552 length:129 start_codon:yes stop_codon:yes gene_type:complete
VITVDELSFPVIVSPAENAVADESFNTKFCVKLTVGGEGDSL